jgi:valyl-tRNA synthetase
MGKNRIRGMVETRPDWLISRQRAWGAPLAMFVDKETGQPLHDDEVNRRIVEAIAAEGAEVVAAAVEPPREQRVRHTYTLQLSDAGRLPTLMRAMRDVPGVYDVTRSRPPTTDG